MNQEKNTYKQILKTTSIFGGVQVYNIFIAVVRSKIVAVLLGPAGIGISGLYQNATGLVSGFSSFGLNNSGVKSISESNEKEKTVSVLYTLLLFTGILGTLVGLIFAKQLSISTFGSSEYTLQLRWLSATILFNQLAAGYNAILTGYQAIKQLAAMNVWIGIVGLLVSVPLFYFYGIEGIVPSIWISSFLSFGVGWYFVNKLVKRRLLIGSMRDVFRSGREMLKLGFLLNINTLFTLLIAYLIRIYISKTGGLLDVGLYTAAFLILNTYVGMVFTAMSTDYFPSLSKLGSNIFERNGLVNRQIEIGLLLISPMLIAFSIVSKQLIIVFYSNTFLPIQDLLLFALLGMYLKVVGWGLGYLYLACGTQKNYFINETIFNVFNLVSSIVGYHFWGLMGLGYSFAALYFIYAIYMMFFSTIQMKMNFSGLFYLVLIIQGLLVFASVTLTIQGQTILFALFLFLASSLFSLITLRTRLRNV
jgi:O-antigen/teichoic acid export membrane protein